MGQSKWGRVRDEYGNQWSVQAKEIPKGAESGDNFAYRVDFSEDLAPRLQHLED
jgi:hypothetical protein